jgi:hypothetical protein
MLHPLWWMKKSGATMKPPGSGAYGSVTTSCIMGLMMVCTCSHAVEATNTSQLVSEVTGGPAAVLHQTKPDTGSGGLMYQGSGHMFGACQWPCYKRYVPLNIFLNLMRGLTWSWSQSPSYICHTDVWTNLTNVTCNCTPLFHVLFIKEW